MLSRRHVLIGLATGAAGILLQRHGSAQQQSYAALPDFRPHDARDDNTALQRALASGKPVYLPAGRGSGPGGIYLIGTGASANIGSGTQIFGDGIGRTIVQRHEPGPGYIFFCDSGSADIANNLVDIAISDLTLQDDVVRLGFSEHEHLVHVNGVSRLRIERMGFRGFRGDGLYLGSGVRLSSERHNRDVTISDCEFDGINRNNRNGISVVDGTKVTITGCRFINCTRPGGLGRHGASKAFDPETGISMPGAIDFEPDATFGIIRDVRVDRCHFEGGGGAAVAFLLQPNNRVRAASFGLAVTNCTIERQRIGFEFFGYGGREAISEPAAYGLALANNQLRETDSPFIINGVRGLKMANNTFTDCAKAAELGYTDYNHDCNLSANSFIRVGYSVNGVNGLLIRNADKVTLEGNRFIDCGRADGLAGRAINFAAGSITNFRLLRNRFESPTGRTTYAVGVTGAKLDRGSSAAAGNVFAFPTNRDFG